MIAIIDYRAGNLTSVRLAFRSLNAAAETTSDPDVVRGAERVVLPGVGAAGTAMKALSELGMVEAVAEVVERGVPFLGICLGSQIVLARSDEDGGVDCIGLLPGTVKLFRPANRWDKVPQMGWNGVTPLKGAGAVHPVFEGINAGSEFYFVHSYYPLPADDACILGETEYADVRFASVVGRNNLVATQFHPEKSGRVGLKLLNNFINWNGEYR